VQNLRIEKIEFNKKTLVSSNDYIGKLVMGDDVYISFSTFLYNIENAHDDFKGKQ
jgi:hypothetical protein